jgi:hypothetical protein
MSKRKADESESGERETKKQKATKEPRIEDADMLLFIHGYRGNAKSLEWHFKPFWVVRWNLPENDDWWARMIRGFDKDGTLDDPMDGDSVFSKSRCEDDEYEGVCSIAKRWISCWTCFST